MDHLSRIALHMPPKRAGAFVQKTLRRPCRVQAAATAAAVAVVYTCCLGVVWVPIHHGPFVCFAGARQQPVKTAYERKHVGLPCMQYAETQEAELLERIPIDQLKVGQELPGIVTKVIDYGIFVDVGAERGGLVHRSRVTGDFIEDIYAVAQVDDEVTVWVVNVNNGRLELTMKNPSEKMNKMDVSAFKGVDPETWVDGIVHSIKDFGVRVAVKPPVDSDQTFLGLVHITKMNGFVRHPSDVVQIGQHVRVRIVDVEEKRQRLELSMLDLAEPTTIATVDTASTLLKFESIPSSEWLVGRVHHTKPFGAFIDVEVPEGGTMFQGTVHTTQIRKGFVDDPATVLKVGQEVNVRVKRVDTDSERLALTMRPLDEE